MSLRGLLPVVLALLALGTLAAPAQADPVCLGPAGCAGDAPCLTATCVQQTAAATTCLNVLCASPVVACLSGTCTLYPQTPTPECNYVVFGGTTITDIRPNWDCILHTGSPLSVGPDSLPPPPVPLP